MPTKSAKDDNDTKTASVSKPKPDPSEKPLGSLRIVGTPSEDARLFQTAPDEKRWLTKDEAENWEVTLPDGSKKKSPFFWAPD